MNIAHRFLHEGSTPALAYEIDGSRCQSVSCTELHRHALALSAALKLLGVQTGDRVVLINNTGIRAVEMILAGFAAGATAVPLSTLTPTAALVAVVNEIRPTCCVVDEIPQGELLAALQAHCRVFITTGAAQDYWHGCDTLISCPPCPVQPASDEDVALIVHTSGSSGMPKSVVMTHRALHTFMDHHDFLFSQFLADSAPILTVLPLTHLGGLGICLQGLQSCRPTHLASQFIPSMFLQLLARTRANLTMLVPSMYRALLREPRTAENELEHLRFCITLGEPCSAELAQQIGARFGAVVASAYGMTECLTGIGHLRDDIVNARVVPGSCGTLCFGEARLVDREGNDQPSFGELWVRNPTVHRCYLDPTLLEDRIQDGWFRTRDLFYRDEDGRYFHRGRSDDMFIHNGKNVYPAEIESVLQSHPDIEQVCAVAIHDPIQGSLPAVMVRARRSLPESEVLDFSAHNGPGHGIPKLVYFSERFPETGPGKVDRALITLTLQSAYDRMLPASES